MDALTDAQRELLEDKFVLWDRASRDGSMDLRDYNRRAAEALKKCLALASAYGTASAPDSSEPLTNEAASAAHAAQVERDKSREEP